MDFATGFATGWAFAKKMFEGGGSEYVNNDPDYALYKTMPEPSANQITILLRIADGANQSYISIHYDSSYGPEDISDYDEGIIDWGDGTIEGIGKMWSGSHAYSISGDYIITVTDNSGGRIESVCCSRRYNYGYPIALKVGASLIYDDGLGSKVISSNSNFKYIQFASNYLWENGYVINALNRLTRLDFLDSGQPDKLVNNQFRQCYSLDFENLLPFFANVTEVGNNVLCDCYNLKELSLPKCTKVGDSSIYQCYSLTHVDMPLCTEIGKYAIGYNHALREVNMPLCTAVNDYALSSNYALNKVTLAEGCSFGSNAMRNSYCLIPTPNNIYPY